MQCSEYCHFSINCFLTNLALTLTQTILSRLARRGANYKIFWHQRIDFARSSVSSDSLKLELSLVNFSEIFTSKTWNENIEQAGNGKKRTSAGKSELLCNVMIFATFAHLPFAIAMAADFFGKLGQNKRFFTTSKQLDVWFGQNTLPQCNSVIV